VNVGVPVAWIGIHRKMKVGCSRLLGVTLPSQGCQIIAVRGGNSREEIEFFAQSASVASRKFVA